MSVPTVRKPLALLALLSALVLFAVPSEAAPVRATGVRNFVKRAKPPQGRQRFIAGRKVPRLFGKLLGRRGAKRKLVSVDNSTMKSFLKDTSKGYLEVVIPANVGHVWFRYGEQVYDFGPKGFRAGPVREIKGDRYGVLVPLTTGQEERLAHYLDRLVKTDAAELGLYDFHGDKGFHCVTWLMRHSFGSGDTSLVRLLGGTDRDGTSMPRFSKFMLKRAKGVEATIVYSKEPKTSKQLDAQKFEVISYRDLRAAFEENGTFSR